MTTAQQLDLRYGRGRARRAPLIVGIALAAVVVLAAGWLTVTASMNSVDADDLGYDVVDAHSVSVRFQVTGAQNRTVACALEALDEEFGIVGWRILELPARAEHTQTLTVDVPTVAGATTGLVNSCWVT